MHRELECVVTVSLLHLFAMAANIKNRNVVNFDNPLVVFGNEGKGSPPENVGDIVGLGMFVWQIKTLILTLTA